MTLESGESDDKAFRCVQSEVVLKESEAMIVECIARDLLYDSLAMLIRAQLLSASTLGIDPTVSKG